MEDSDNPWVLIKTVDVDNGAIEEHSWSRMRAVFGFSFVRSGALELCALPVSARA